ncbi:MAG: peptide deformylase [Candidatus Acetothermia bacterium]
MEIVTHPADVLRQKAAPIDEITDEIRDLADKMTETMFREEGVGLAAPQVGVSKQLIVVDLEEEFYILANPEIVERSEEEETSEEGCLSVPGPEAPVTRAKEVVVSGRNLDGEELEFSAKGVAARVFQHEVDHINGILFIDRLSEAERSLTLREYRKAQEESREEAESPSVI